MGKRNMSRLARQRLLAAAGAVAVLLVLTVLLYANRPSAKRKHVVSTSAIRRLALRRVCTDICYKARDGVCDEGRPGSASTPPPAQGRKSLALHLLCDLGTDCTDCGEWSGSTPGQWDGLAGPVAWARSRNITMQVRTTTTPIPFLVAITSDKADPDVSSMLLHYGAMEGGITRIAHWLLSGHGCVSAAGGRRWMLDVGASMGYYTLLAASYGCDVVSWEPLRAHRAFLEWSVHANGVAHRVYIRPTALTHTAAAASEDAPAAAQLARTSALEAGAAAATGDTLNAAPFLAPHWSEQKGKGPKAGSKDNSHSSSGCSRGFVRLGVAKDGTYWGLASVNSINLLKHEIASEVCVPGETLDQWSQEVMGLGRQQAAARGAGSLLSRLAAPLWSRPGAHRVEEGAGRQAQQVALLKLDIEGYEPRVLEGGAALLRSGRVDHVLTEYSPGVSERTQDMQLQRALPRTLAMLAAGGGGENAYTLAHLPLFGFAAPWPPKRLNGSEPLPVLEEVGQGELAYDMQALKKRASLERSGAAGGACGVPPELARWGVWAGCREWAVGVHPKGFRSAFGFNTNVWAARKGAASHGLLRLQGRASLFAAGQDMKVWTSQSRPGIGIGLLDCSSIGAGHRVLFHCNCDGLSGAGSKECNEQSRMVEQLAQQGRMPLQ